MAGSAEPRPIRIEKLASFPERRKLTPRVTAKKLPWLDGKSSPAAPATPPIQKARVLPRTEISSPPKRRESSQLKSSPLPKNAPTSFPKAEPTIRPVGSPSPLHRISSSPPIEQRVSSAGASSPSPVPRNRLSQIRRDSINHKGSSPLREAVSPAQRYPPSKKKRPSIVHIPGAYPDQYEDSFDGVPRRGSLAPVPAHLDRSSTPDYVRRPVQRNLEITSPSPAIKSAEISPTQPMLKRKPSERVNSRRLSNAIEGLDDLVQEAVNIAEGTADQDQVEEIYEIIEDATNAIQEASTAPARHLMATTSPLEISSSSEEGSEYSSMSLVESPNEPYPPLVTPVQRNIQEHSGEATPPRFYPDQQRGSEAIDWAYQDRKSRAEERSLESPGSDSDDSIGRGRSRFGTRSDLLLPPQPTQTAPRENVDFVLRPTVAREHPRGRSRLRKARDSDLGTKRHRSRRREHRSSSYGQLETTLDEEDLEVRHRPRRYKNELSVRDEVHNHTFSLRRHHERQPIARNWHTSKKRITATIACINTALLGIIVGIYAGEVPRIQYMLADEHHHVIVGNVVLYSGLAISTFVSWPLPLLHGRKPYILASLALALPLQFPQAIVVSAKRSPMDPSFKTGLLIARGFSGIVLGFANVNFITVLLDLFGASLQSKNPHQEFVVANDIRRHGGGMGLWLGIWSWCSIGSLAVGFQIGAAVIESLTPEWGFYIIIIILAVALVLNVIAPETRRSAYRKSVTEVYDRDEQFITRRVARGEVKLHISTEGPKYWFEEVWAGLKLTIMMCCQPGFAVLALYLGWIYAQIVLVIVLLGALLSREYRWHPLYVGLGVLSIAIGALLAVPLTKAGIFSRERKNPFRTDSMTFQKQLTWSSHLVRRIIFTLTLPLMGLAYTVSSAGRPKPYMVPITFAGAVGFLSILAIAECHGLIMETFDTCDLQPGVNTRHRLQSLAVQDRRRRTNYSSFPRVTSGIFASQTLAFIGAAVATEVGGIMTRHIGAQASTGVTAGILLGLTILLTAVLWRFREVQVIPNHTFGTRRDTKAWEEFRELEKGKSDWKAVVIGNPSGKMRRISVLESGGLSRWTEIRKLNFLIRGEGVGTKKKSWSSRS